MLKIIFLQNFEDIYSLLSLIHHCSNVYINLISLYFYHWNNDILPGLPFKKFILVSTKIALAVAELFILWVLHIFFWHLKQVFIPFLFFFFQVSCITPVRWLLHCLDWTSVSLKCSLMYSKFCSCVPLVSILGYPFNFIFYGSNLAMLY